MKNKIKIFFIIPRFYIGGAERFTIDLIKHLDREKFDISLICLKDAEPETEIWREEIEVMGYPVIIIGKKTKLGLGCLFKLFWLLKKEKPEIVHTMIFSGDVYGRVAAKIAGIKVIISTEQNLNYGESAVKHFLKKVTAPLSDKVVVISRAVKSYVIAYEGVKAEQVEIIPNAVEKFIAPNSLSFVSGKKFTIGFMGRLTEQKGLECLLEAMALLKHKNIECLIAGDGEDRKKLEDLVESKGLNEIVYFVGWQKNRFDFFRLIDSFILPSRWEGLGVVLLEAGLFKLPVIASNIDGIVDVIDDNINGLLFSSGEARELAEKIELLKNNVELGERLGKNLEGKVLEKFNISNISKSYENLYLEILSKKNG
jgi:glycosyltransferase involved in cell wall biosynthesis